MERKRYAVVGTGGRSLMYIEATAGEYKNCSELVGFCDPSKTRMAYYNKLIANQYGHAPVPTYAAEDFEKMIAEQKPDVVVVTTIDYLHHKYAIRAMELGCDVITEKPMTTDDEKAQAMLDAVERTGQKLRVAFNYRYAPYATKIRELMMSKVIGEPLAVDFSWLLDTSHGADYFRRWHREKDKSGGLLVHKSTHHFDLVNWWIGSQPREVYAMGGLKFYGKANAEARGEKYSYDRYASAEAANDPFALKLETSPFDKSLYQDAEKETGYIRDRNVFGENVTIEDTMAVLAKYHNGVILNYSLIAYSPWEGFQIAISGTRGRIEFSERRDPYIVGRNGSGGMSAAPQVRKKLTVCPMFGNSYEVEIPEIAGGHGGGDTVLCEQLFAANPPVDPYGRAASHFDGAGSILLGIAANRSIASGLPVKIEDLVKLPA